MVRQEKRNAVEATPTEDDANVPEVIPEYRRQQLVEQAKAALPELTTRVMSMSELHSISSMDDAVALFQQTSGQDIVEARDEIGDGFDYLENKDLLVGRSMLILQWECGLSPSFTDKEGNPLKTVQAWCVVNAAGEVRKVRISDFSTGICSQLWDYTTRNGRAGGLMAPKGLRKSEFPYVDPTTGERSVAKTYYIDLSRDL